MKRGIRAILLLGLFFLFIARIDGFAQCNTNTSICTAGTAGPFNFQTPGPAVGSCLDWIGPDIGYIILYITQSGPLQLLIDGDAASGCIDVAIFNVPSGVNPCDATLNPANEIGCNYASNCDGCNQFGTYFPCLSSVPSPNVSAGDVLMIVVENWSGSSNNFTLDLGPPPAAQTGPPDATINPAGPFCDTDGATQLTAVNMGGVWSGPGTTSGGVFDPAVAGAGIHAIDYSIGQSPCDDQDQILITVVLCSCVQIDNINTINPDCAGGNNGSIEVMASGGTTPYQYSIDGGVTYQGGNIFTGLFSGTYDVQVQDAGGCVSAVTTVTITDPLILTVTAACNDATTPGGSDGSSTASPSGGTSPYSYQWDDASLQTTISATGLPAGTYTVIVTDDAGCTATDNCVVNEPGCTLTAGANQTDVSCYGGSDGTATAVPSGGNTPFVYLWSNNQSAATATGLEALTYTVTITDINSCTAVAGVSINEPTALVMTTTVTDATCGNPDGEACVSVSGGIGSYTFSWSNSSNTNCTGSVTAANYTVTVTDGNGCTIVNTLSVNDLGAPAAMITVSGNVSCYGGSDGFADLAVSGGTAPYTYLWSNGASTQNITGVGSDSYDVMVTDDVGCVANASVTITEPALLTADINNIVDVSCNGGSDGAIDIDVLGGTLPYSYNWSNGPGTQDINNIPQGSYAVTVTDANLCSVITSATVSEASALTMNVTVTDVGCNGGNDGVAGCIVGGGNPNYTYSWITGAVTASISNIPAGTYCVTATDDNGCTITNCVTVSEPSALSAGIVGTDATCSSSSDGSADLTVGGGTPAFDYIWSNGDTTEDLTGISSDEYTVTVTDAQNCSITANVTIADPSGLTVLMSNTNVSCNGGNDGTATATVNGGVTPYFYQWCNGQTGVSSTGLSAGVCAVTVTDDNGCSVSQSITLNQPPALTAAGNSTDVVCAGQSNGTATVTVNGGSPSYSHLWSNSQTAPTATGLAAGNYQVTSTDVNGCSIVTNINVNEPNIVQVVATVISDYNGVNVSCNGGADGEASANASGGIGPYTYIWNNAQPSAIATGLSASNYSVTATDNNGCTASGSVTLTEPSPVSGAAVVSSDYNGQDISCNGGSDGQVTGSGSGGISPYNFQWDANAAGQTTATANNLSAGNYNVTITDDNACTTTASVSINEPPPVNVTASSIDPSCNGYCDGVVMANGSGGTPGYTFTWNGGIGTGDTISGACSFVYTVQVSDNNNCTATATTTLTDPDPLTFTISQNTTICRGTSTNISVSNISGGNSPYYYTWEDGSTGSATSVSPLVNPTCYRVTVTDQNGCSSISNNEVCISLYDPLNLNLVGDTFICENDAVSIMANAGGGDPANVYTYFWNDGSTISIGTSNSFQVTPYNYPDPVTYIVSVTDNCTSPVAVDTFVVNYHSTPMANFTTDISSDCAPLNLSFSNRSNGFGKDSCIWDMGDGNGMIRCDTSFSYTYVDPGVYQVQLKGYSEELCPSLPFTATVQAYPNPIADFVIGNQPTNVMNTQIPFTDYTISGDLIAQWTWTFYQHDNVTALDTTDIRNPTYTFPEDTGVYPVHLEVLTANNCKDDTTHYVYIDGYYALYTPNAFSPNEDGRNDFFFPTGIGIDENNFTLYIFNRWGELVFESNDPADWWDGTYQGKKAQEGVYVWRLITADLTQNSRRREHTGHVTLLR